MHSKWDCFTMIFFNSAFVVPVVYLF